MSQVTVVIPALNTLGECPRWNPENQTLYWLDIAEQILHAYTPATYDHKETLLEERVSAFAFRRSGGYLFATTTGIAQADKAGRIRSYYARPQLEPDARFNDGVVDPAGRFWAGTLNAQHRPNNSLYCLHHDGTLAAMLHGITASNGIGWSPDTTVMYFVDSRLKTILAYDYDVETGAIANRRVFVETQDEDGVPDGIAVDVQGHVWCAYWDGWRVVRYDPEGRMVAGIQMPVARPTACAFGENNLDSLYITSARFGLSETELARQPLAGSLFVHKAAISGLPTVLAHN